MGLLEAVALNGWAESEGIRWMVPARGSSRYLHLGAESFEEAWNNRAMPIDSDGGASVLHSSTWLQRNGDVVSSEIDGEVVMMSVEQGQYYGLDDVGSDIWRELERPTTVAALLDSLSERYTADRAVLERDTLQLLGQLLERRVLETIP